MMLAPSPQPDGSIIMNGAGTGPQGIWCQITLRPVALSLAKKREKSVGDLQKLVYISPAANFTSPCVQRMRR